MTRFFNSNIKTKLILLLTVLCLLFSCIGLYACDEDNDVKDPEYSVQEEADDVIIKNASFDIGTYGIELKNYPITSPSSWTKAQTDNGSASSSVNSGTVEATASSWEALLKNLYSDSDFVSYVQNLADFDNDDVQNAIRLEKGDDEYEVTEEEIVEYVIENYLNVSNDKISYTNPGKSPDADDDFIYMLNNVGKKANLGLGLAQKITSSSSVALKAKKVYEISVWVKTANVSGQGDFGANIRLTNNFDAKPQQEYRISNIVANDWTKYTVYVKTDATYAGTLSLVLGLGYGEGDSNASNYFAEGTAYFDEITVKEIDAEDFTETLASDYMVLGSEEPLEANLTAKAEKHFACVYEMSVAHNETGYLSPLSTTVTSAFTTSNVIGEDGAITSENKVGPESTQTLTNNDGVYTMEVNKASATVTVKNDASFTLASEEYALISFYVKNELQAPADTNVYVDVIDSYQNVTVKRASVFTIGESDGEYKRFFLLVKNNFKDGFNRDFYLNLVVGPNDVASVVYDSDFSTGKVFFKDFKIAKDSIDADLANEDFTEIYSFLSEKASATVALYAGYEADYTESEDADSYYFSTRPGNLGDVMFGATNVQGYTGIVPNHTFITSSDTAETYVNTRIKGGRDYNVNGVAGLINTKYLANYDDGDEIKSKLGFENGDDDMQLIMIKNNVADHYGFVGEKITVSSSSYAAVSVTLKVCDDAVAYVYLTDVTGTNKNVLTFNSFKVNTDVVNGVEKDTFVDGSNLRYQLQVTSDMMNADGYITVSFYIATGASTKSFRVEVWNGARDGKTDNASTGYVFIKNIASLTSSAFEEGASWNTTFTTEGNPLYDAHKSTFSTLYAYERQLSEIEVKYNEEYPDSIISYPTNYVWAQSKQVIYSVLNSIDPVYTDPYEDVEEEEEGSGCAAETDPSAFWLSFSSILLAVVLVAAITILIVKNVVAKKRANKSDALSHYKVVSRTKKVKEKEENANVEVTKEKEDETTEIETETENDSVETEEGYVYGDVQLFGEEDQPTDETPKDETSTEEQE